MNLVAVKRRVMTRVRLEQLAIARGDRLAVAVLQADRRFVDEPDFLVWRIPAIARQAVA